LGIGETFCEYLWPVTVVYADVFMWHSRIMSGCRSCDVSSIVSQKRCRRWLITYLSSGHCLTF
jgi:hypothetical protein